MSSPADTETPEARPEGEPDVDEAAAPEVDEVRQALLAELTEALGDAVVGSEVAGGDLWVRVRRDAWRRAAEVCKARGFDYFCFLSGIDWMPAPKGAGEGDEAMATGDTGDSDESGEAEEAAAEEPGAEAPAPTVAETQEGWVTGVAGGDTRFQVFGRLYSTTRKLGVTLKADLDDDEQRVASWTPVYRGADWHERETWEMFGFAFEGHGNLTHIYLPAEFEGHPLRKDFPLLSREVKPWPGLVDVEAMPEVEEPAPTPAAESSETPADTGEGS